MRPCAQAEAWPVKDCIYISPQRVGGISALVCVATYLFGFVFLATCLAPLGYGTTAVDAKAVAAFIHASPRFLIVWNSVIYILNAMALTALVVALHAHQSRKTPDWAAETRAIGIMWAGLVLGAGMIANVAVERAAYLYPTDPFKAAQVWDTLHAVELGLGGDNEIAGEVWIPGGRIEGIIGRSLGGITNGLGLMTGFAGLATLSPDSGDIAGAVFGLGAIAWFIAAGVSLKQDAAPPAQEQY